MLAINNQSIGILLQNKTPIRFGVFGYLGFSARFFMMLSLATFVIEYILLH